MTTPVKSLIPLSDTNKPDANTYTGKYTGILDQEEQVSLNSIPNPIKKGEFGLNRKL